jgi:lipoyl(octanoyl) transferase
MDYEPVWHAMQRFTNERSGSRHQDGLVVQHPVFTQGQAGKAEHLLPGDIPVVGRSRRASDLSWPRPVGGLPVAGCAQAGFGVRELVTAWSLPDRLLASYGVTARPSPMRPACMSTGENRFLGLRIRNGCSFTAWP